MGKSRGLVVVLVIVVAPSIPAVAVVDLGAFAWTRPRTRHTQLTFSR